MRPPRGMDTAGGVVLILCLVALAIGLALGWGVR